MSKDMTNEILKGVVAHADGQIAKHKVNILVQCKNSVGVGEHSDHVETIEKEMEQIAHYDDIKSVVKNISQNTQKKDFSTSDICSIITTWIFTQMLFGLETRF